MVSNKYWDCVSLLLARGKATLIDAEDFEKVANYCWLVNRDGYVRRSNPKRGGRPHVFWIHRVVMGYPDRMPRGLMIDHVNHDPLDNRKHNLRVCTMSQNQANRPKVSQKCTSKYKGVIFSGSSWIARATFRGVTRHIGSFKSEAEAALAYNKVAKEIHGDFACLNDVVEPVVRETPHGER